MSDLEDVPTSELIAELEHRRHQKVVRLRVKKEPLIFRCTSCGDNEPAGSPNTFADNTPYGVIWHRLCTDWPNKKSKGRMVVEQGHFSMQC